MYTFWKRAAPPASMEIFNAPTREVLHGAPRADQHADAGAGGAERPAVHRGGSRYLAQRTLTVAGDAVENRLDFHRPPAAGPAVAAGGAGGAARRAWTGWSAYYQGARRTKPSS